MSLAFYNSIYLPTCNIHGPNPLTSLYIPSSSSEDDNVVFLNQYTSMMILHTKTIPSSSPGGTDNTLQICVKTLQHHFPMTTTTVGERGGYSAFGVAKCRPVGLSPFDKEMYGKILWGGLKRDWRGVDFLTPLLDGCSGAGGGGGGKEAVLAPPLRQIKMDMNAADLY